MLDFSKFDDDLVNLYNIVLRLNYNDLHKSIEDKSLYKKLHYKYQFGDKIDYKELNLTKYQQEVLENYLKFAKKESDAKVFLAYLKGIEHTLNFINNTEILRNKNTPKK